MGVASEAPHQLAELTGGGKYLLKFWHAVNASPQCNQGRVPSDTCRLFARPGFGPISIMPFMLSDVVTIVACAK